MAKTSPTQKTLVFRASSGEVAIKRQTIWGMPVYTTRWDTAPLHSCITPGQSHMNELELKNWKVECHLPAILTWVSNKISADGSAIYKHHFDLGIVDWRVIAYLGVFGAGTNQSICEFIGLDKAAVSRSISRLKERDLATTRSIDGRTTEVVLTAAGLSTGNKMLTFAEEIEKAMTVGLEEKELEAFRRTLTKIIANLPYVRALRP